MLRHLISDTELQDILRWRNHPTVRQVMFTNHEISWEEHLRWWNSVKSDPSREVLLFSYQDQPIGVVQLFDIDAAAKTCHWGFYLDNKALHDNVLRMQIWLRLEQETIDYVFNHLGYQTLICETLLSNTSVVAIHRRFGFQETKQYLKDRNDSKEPVVEMVIHNPAIAISLDTEISVQESQDNEASESISKSSCIAFLGSANWDLAAATFKNRYLGWVGQQIEVLPIPFGQYQGYLADTESPLHQISLDAWLFCERIEDFIPSLYKILKPSDFDTIEYRFKEYLERIQSARHQTDAHLYVLDFYPIVPTLATLEDSRINIQSIALFVDQLNHELYQICQALPDCTVIHLSNLVPQIGIQQSNPGKYWHLGKMPFSNKLTEALSDRLIGTFLAQKGKTARLIITDLDNTLWGGVIGDDGLQAIQLGGDYPGSIFSEIQETLKGLQTQGIALAICSKNTESIALRAIKMHPSMRLTTQDFVSIRINWQDKAKNIVEIANEVGVGLASVLFMDDSPYERSAIRQELPQVLVPEMPKDPLQWPSFLLSHPYLARLQLTSEDTQRAQRYTLRARVQQESHLYTNKQEFWQSLKMNLTLHHLGNGNQQRVLQLLAKTNQFNMTTQRYSALELHKVETIGGYIFPVGLSDKYSEHEIIGVIILVKTQALPNTLTIDSFLLSCRVLGRGIEPALLHWVSSKASQLGFRYLQGSFIQSTRNTPARQAYLDFGFDELGDGNFRLDLDKHPGQPVHWLSIHEDL